MALDQKLRTISEVEFNNFRDRYLDNLPSDVSTRLAGGRFMALVRQVAEPDEKVVVRKRRIDETPYRAATISIAILEPRRPSIVEGRREQILLRERDLMETEDPEVLIHRIDHILKQQRREALAIFEQVARTNVPRAAQIRSATIRSIKEIAERPIEYSDVALQLFDQEERRPISVLGWRANKYLDSRFQVYPTEYDLRGRATVFRHRPLLQPTARMEIPEVGETLQLRVVDEDIWVGSIPEIIRENLVEKSGLRGRI